MVGFSIALGSEPLRKQSGGQKCAFKYFRPFALKLLEQGLLCRMGLDFSLQVPLGWKW